jgi:hypothetical protein
MSKGKVPGASDSYFNIASLCRKSTPQEKASLTVIPARERESMTGQIHRIVNRVRLRADWIPDQVGNDNEGYFSFYGPRRLNQNR